MNHITPLDETYLWVRALMRFVAFDALHMDGHDVTDMTLEERRDLLEDLITPAQEPIRLSESFAGTGAEFLGAADRMGLEGIVSKQAASVYLHEGTGWQIGRRRGDRLGRRRALFVGHLDDADHITRFTTTEREKDQIIRAGSGKLDTRDKWNFCLRSA